MNIVGTIYKITNTINYKCYIGQTIKVPEERWRQHKRNMNYESCKSIALYKAFRKHGIDNFTFEVIETGIAVEDLNEKEIWYIAEYCSRTNGYNMVDGGKSVRGYKFTKDTLTTLSAKRKGSVPWNKGKRMPEISGKYSAVSKEVFCYENNTKYVSCTEAAKALNLSVSSIVAVCKGKRIQTGGYTFGYIVDGKPVKVDKSNLRVGGNNVNAKCIICTTTGKEYMSIAEAAKDLDLKAGSVAAVCKKQRNSVYGYKFIYKETE